MNEENMNLATRPQGGALAEVETQRAIAETQGAMVIAKRFPRDQKVALDRIMQACTRPGLAEQALYSYNRGGTDVTGPSIRLAETLAQQWGNMQFGVRELEQRSGESTVEAFAWDIETNTRQVKVFQVPHVRYRRPEKGGSVKLDDPRDIYEHVANQGARRLRACILGVIPGDVVEDAVRQCEVTMTTKAEVTPERIHSLLTKFAGYGVSKEMIEKHIQRRIESLTPALLVKLGKIFNSLKDGMSAPGDWFDVPKAAEGVGNAPDKGLGAFMAATEAHLQPEPAEPASADPELPAEPKSGAPTIKEVSALIQKGDLDAAADLARSFPEAERAVLEASIKAKAKK